MGALSTHFLFRFNPPLTNLSELIETDFAVDSQAALSPETTRMRPQANHDQLPSSDWGRILLASISFPSSWLCFDLRSDQLYFHPASLSFIGTRKRSSSAAKTLSFAMDPLPQFSRIAPPRSRRPPSLRSFRPSTQSLSALATYLSFLLASSWVSSVSAQNANTAINLDEMETMCVLSSPSLRTHIRIWPDSTTMKQVQFWR